MIAKFIAPVDDSVDTEELTDRIVKNLNSTKYRLMELNKIANSVITDFNNYSSTAHVSPLTGVNYYTTISLSIYLLLVVFIVGFMSVICVLTYEIIKLFRGKPEEDEDSKKLVVSNSGNASTKRVKVQAVIKKSDE